MSTIYSGVLRPELDAILSSATDHGGNPVEPFVDHDGGWPLRCCLEDSAPGEELAILAFSPFPWPGAYSETGPVVVHARGCAGASGRFPGSFEARRQVVRAFGEDGGRIRTQVYELHRLVEPGDGLQTIIERILDDPRVEFVLSHNVLPQCFSFAARRSGPPSA